jgi:hypothetical protein
MAHDSVTIHRQPQQQNSNFVDLRIDEAER